MFDIMFVPKAERSRATILNHVTRTVYLLGSQFKLPRGASSLVSVKRLNSVKNTSQTGETLCYETVRRLFNLHIAIIFHGFTVVTLTAP